MKGQTSRVVLLAGLCLAGLAGGLSGAWLVLGTALTAALAVAIGVGFGPRARSVGKWLVALAAAHWLLLGAIAWFNDDAAEPTLFWGLPAATAPLVYGIWPLGATAGLLYGLRFHRDVLPEDRLRDFERRFGPRRD